MKSEERHELERNDLATSLSDPMSLWRRHGNKVLIVLTVALLVLWAVRYKRAQAAAKEEQTRQALANAWSGLAQLPQLAAAPANPEITKLRSGLETEINQNVALVTDDSDTPAPQAAWAWLARGEMYWGFAHLPGSASTASPTTQATTVPTSQPAGKSADEYLGLAANAYGSVVEKYPNESTAVTIARFALAAIAEEKHDLAGARKQYQALIETPNFLTPTTSPSNPDAKSMAEARLAMLNSLEKPTLLLPATQPVGGPSTDDLLKGLGNMQLGSMGPMPASTPATTQPK